MGQHRVMLRAGKRRPERLFQRHDTVLIQDRDTARKLIRMAAAFHNEPLWDESYRDRQGQAQPQIVIFTRR